MLDFLKIADKKESPSGKKQPKFDVVLQEVEGLSLRAKAHSPVEKVPEQGRFLKLGSHKVTGKELNAVTAQIDESFIQTQNIQIESLQHIVQLYQALEVLDTEHIAGILTAIKAADTATDWARINDENIGKITSYLMEDDRVLAYKKEQDERITTLGSKMRTAYLVAGSSVVVALTSLVLCLIAII